MRKIHLYSLCTLLFSAAFFSCVKEDDIDKSPDTKLTFSADTVLFDTVFTTVGSATQVFKVYNPSNKKVIISSISLGKGNNSPYSFNVDGIVSSEIRDFELMSKDSAFVFVKVTIDPNDANSPLIHQDSLVFNTNDNRQDVKLVAWGQDAYFYNRALIASDYVFENDKPHVIYNYLIVDSLKTLEIEAGARVHMHAGAMLIVYNSASLKITGTAEEPVIIEGDRLEDYYKDIPGQWGRIWLYPGSIDNEIDYAIIRNGETGIQVDTLGNSVNPTLRIKNTMIYNMTSIGLLAQGTNIEAANCVFANCGSYALALTLGGNYDFRHCTIGNYWRNFQRLSGLALNNYYIDIDENEQLRPLENAYFGNCLIYGETQDELTLDKAAGNAAFNFTFDHCIIKTTLNVSNSANFINTTRNTEPWFRDPYKAEFQPDSTLSSVINKGSIDIVNNALFDITKDIDQNSRTNDEAPDVGAYEFVLPEPDRTRGFHSHL